MPGSAGASPARTAAPTAPAPPPACSAERRAQLPEATLRGIRPTLRRQAAGSPAVAAPGGEKAQQRAGGSWSPVAFGQAAAAASGGPRPSRQNP
eukprot:6553333-Lingulodinium_polyedra.AAC.1